MGGKSKEKTKRIKVFDKKINTVKLIKSTFIKTKDYAKNTRTGIEHSQTDYATDKVGGSINALANKAKNVPKVTKRTIKTAKKTIQTTAKTVRNTIKASQKAIQTARYTTKITAIAIKATIKTIKATVVVLKGMGSLVAMGGVVAVVIIILLCMLWLANRLIQ